MKTKFSLLVIIALLSANASAQKQMRVAADSVNMRAKPNTSVETVKPQLNEDDVVTVRKVVGEWAEIAPPKKADLYVYGEFVKDGVIQVSKLRVRSGPSISYKEVGMVNKGDRIDERGVFGDWIKIAPPPQTSLWVNTQYLQQARQKPSKPKPVVDPKPTVRTPPKQDPQLRKRETIRKSEKPRRTIVRSVKPLPKEKKARKTAIAPDRKTSEADYVPSDLDLIPLKGQGAMTEMEGILRSSGFTLFSRSPAKYRLIIVRGNGFKTICYIKGNERQLKAFAGKILRVKGREYWVRGEDVPVIVPTRIMPAR